ncbi:hypothetical protein BDV93DRAFT_561429 [Ceratobasidium sp. AG-I]|nr:hypothetical protein BDV93DRAFT_561429 [Ceratobasidium sp. AG-I]
MSLLTTTRDALVLPSAGISPLIAQVTISPHVRHRAYPHPRSLDLHPHNYLAHVGELTIDGTVYCMYYALAPSLPVHKSMLRLLGLKDEPKGRLAYRGDITLVKVGGPSASDVCDRCYENVSISILPWVKAQLQKLWEVRLLESEFAKMKQLANNPGARRGMSDRYYGQSLQRDYYTALKKQIHVQDNLVAEVHMVEAYHYN